jgi:hypothetical protein
MVRLEMFPGRFAVEGVNRKDGRSTGGRGAGPGFMNWFGEYMLREGQQVITGLLQMTAIAHFQAHL